MNDSINRKSFGNRIKTGREQMGLTRDEFAEMINLSTSFFTQIERGEKLMSVQTLVKIAIKLNLSLDYLIWGDSSIDVNKDSLISDINNASKRELKVINDIFNAVLPNLKK
ncbi:helix-turn-helix domain-containing protein [Clostridium beijerinckii]|uniref:helix-turn-helix domain-containing protein n=1 Tax=Clostridium beijerinckii TaxID=1520 RepID=UPI0013614E49|nr:helix-turn-helix transcriptional regulator [Clostridium beijerinckii]MZK49039.1 helix-turn-helix domain-containing protein [Clostridium beijerinckii]MZK57414.1 helix-turn-helix domain-containing protein [Clostridium beijerinckii]MZK67625.1 helix-turn-helix domain-containing protein [Clostridium beijerinckii]MZK72710.1 helix-turn-helix domain-containing protein [Clostridium beijerinckii]MZK82306.1 helix-turn-helix domain-containing protein [Clostridium beijerinckii]